MEGFPKPFQYIPIKKSDYLDQELMKFRLCHHNPVNKPRAVNLYHSRSESTQSIKKEIREHSERNQKAIKSIKIRVIQSEP